MLPRGIQVSVLFSPLPFILNKAYTNIVFHKFIEWTRAFNGELPGPTIRVKPGDRMFIRFVNELGPNQEDDNECSDHKCHNIFHFANVSVIV